MQLMWINRDKFYYELKESGHKKCFWIIEKQVAHIETF